LKAKSAGQEQFKGLEMDISTEAQKELRVDVANSKR
jgi:hypothetical protein